MGVRGIIDVDDGVRPSLRDLNHPGLSHPPLAWRATVPSTLRGGACHGYVRVFQQTVRVRATAQQARTASCIDSGSAAIHRQKTQRPRPVLVAAFVVRSEREEEYMRGGIKNQEYRMRTSGADQQRCAPPFFILYSFFLLPPSPLRQLNHHHHGHDSRRS
jgi:hypothetical protein